MIAQASLLLIITLIALAISAANAHSLCKTSLQVADYREQRNGEVFRELTLGVGGHDRERTIVH